MSITSKTKLYINPKNNREINVDIDLDTNFVDMLNNLNDWEMVSICSGHKEDTTDWGGNQYPHFNLVPWKNYLSIGDNEKRNEYVKKRKEDLLLIKEKSMINNTIIEIRDDFFLCIKCTIRNDGSNNIKIYKWWESTIENITKVLK